MSPTLKPTTPITMRNLTTRMLFFICFFISGLLFSQVHVISFNIRYATAADSENQWELRKQEVVAFIKQEQPDFLGIQEALPQQLDYLDNNLKAYNFIGHGRDGINTNSEATPIFFRKHKYELLRSEVFWFSPTPGEPSKGWDAALPRVAVYGAFKEINSADTIHVINTHFDHAGSEARLRSAKQLMHWTDLNLRANEKLILMGDLNCEPDSEPIQLLKQVMTDTYDKGKTTGISGTFTAFDTTRTAIPRIDYIFTKGFHVTASGITAQKRANGLYLSDHFPVWAKMKPKSGDE